MTDKFAVSRLLREIGLLLQLKGENAFKSRAYDAAAMQLVGTAEDLGVLVAEQRLQELAGIGPKIAEAITEIVNTGKSGYHDKLLKEFGPGALELMTIPELGPKRAAALGKLGFSSIAELEAACVAGKLSEVKGFGEKTQARILHNIQMMKKTAGKYRLGSVLPVANELLEGVRAIPGVLRAEVAGAVRRRCETVSEVQLVASAKDPEPVLQAFSSHPEVQESLGTGVHRTKVRLRTGELEVDLRVFSDEDFAAALHHLTGNKGHLQKLRALAKQKGLSLSEYGLLHTMTAEKVPLSDEAALYAALGLPFIPPELREDQGELEAALKGELPKLVDISEIQGVVHSHSTWSDGRNTLEEMARAALALGYRYLTVTEHSESAFYAGGLKPDDLKRQWDEIDRVNETVKGVRLLRGIEADILEDGRLDCDEKLLEKMDVVIGSVHQRHKMDEDQMTARILKAFDSPHLHIWGHATGRLIHKREPYAVRMEEILDKAADKRIAVEINGNPERLDIHSDHVRMAIERGVRLTVSADSHSTREISHLTYAVDVARKGWAAASHILNTLPVTGFTAELHARR